LPPGESAEALRQAVAPWLAEALSSGASRLRHGPEGAAPREQRSCLVAPLLAPAGPLGCLYADIEGAQDISWDLFYRAGWGKKDTVASNGDYKPVILCPTCGGGQYGCGRGQYGGAA
jgi:hypothetical protein